MSTDKTWIEKRLVEAKQVQPVTEAVIVRMKKLLNGQLSERQLSAGQLSDTSKNLLADMAASTPVEEEADSED